MTPHLITSIQIKISSIYSVIRKSLRDFRPLRYISWDGHAEGEHVNRGRDTPSFCPTFFLLICSFLLCLSWLLRSRVRKFRRDLWITLYLLLTFFIPFLKTRGNIWESMVQSQTFPIFTQSDFKQFHSLAITNVSNQTDWSYRLCQSIPDIRSVNYLRVMVCSLPYHGS